VCSCAYSITPEKLSALDACTYMLYKHSVTLVLDSSFPFPHLWTGTRFFLSFLRTFCLTFGAVTGKKGTGGDIQTGVEKLTRLSGSHGYGTSRQALG
jgi:hypothetical protein